MKKIILYGNSEINSVLYKNGYIYDYVNSDDHFLVIKIKNDDDLSLAKKIKKILEIPIVLVIKRTKQNIDFTYLETKFLKSILANDLVKITCIDLKISRSNYYLIIKKLLQKTNLQSFEALKRWALINLSV